MENRKAPEENEKPSCSSETKKSEETEEQEKTKPTPTQSKCFPKYISYQEAKEGLKTGKLQKGVLHINPKFAKQAYIDLEDPSKPKIVTSSFIDRNRALDGDEVILQRKPDPEKEEMEVVSITKKVHPRLAVGYLEPIENNQNFALFSPRDKRFPRLHIYKSHWPHSFDSNPDHFKDVLFLAKISKWVKTKQVQGEIIEILGNSGNLKVETLAILREFCINDKPYNCEVNSSINIRRDDLRKNCVFTIDNPETKDIDDALSCQELPNGSYEIGVHISDVSHFLREETELDEMVMKKATSVYLVDSVYHMLPDELRSLCSLEPGRDKFAFSIFFEVTPDGIISGRRGAKSVINSCAHLNYEQAQKIIDEPTKNLSPSDLPQIHNGFTPQDLSRGLKSFQKIALLLRGRRKHKSGLRPYRPSTSVLLDHVIGEPKGLLSDRRFHSQELVEEFMLLTNVTVAERIYQDFPRLALLRVQEAPSPLKSSRLQKYLESMGIHIDLSSCKKIAESLDKYVGGDSGEVYSLVLNRFINKTIKNKKYICTGTLKKNASFEHFGLGFPIYTHFTSPIRRYVDVTTHRLFSASLKYSPKPKWSLSQVSEIAKTCNFQECQARRAEEASFNLYLNYFIERNQPFLQEAVVYKVKKESLDVIVASTGTSVRIFTNTFDLSWTWKSEKTTERSSEVKPAWKLFITFPEEDSKPEKSVVVDIFSTVKVELMKAPKLNRVKARLCRS